MIYTFGYQGRKPDVLRRLVFDLRGVIVDVRYNPYTTNREWSKNSLVERLGDAYLHLGDWGNRNYKMGGPIEIANFDRGLERLEAIMLRGLNPILMCACRSPRECHRTVLADALRELGHEVKELDLLLTAPRSPEDAGQTSLL